MGKINFVAVVAVIIIASFAVSVTVFAGPMDNANEFAQQAAESAMGNQMDQESDEDSGVISWGDDMRNSTTDETSEQSYEQPDPTAADTQ